jgi:tRNA-dihydrouridine synthase
VNIPVVCNGDVMSYEDGINKMVHPENRDGMLRKDWTWEELLVKSEDIWAKNEHRNETYIAHTSNEEQNFEAKDRVFHKNLDGFMIGRASFGNPWCFLPGNYEPTFEEILSTMETHGKLLWQWKERKGMMEARKHLVQYLHGSPW